VSLGDMIDAVAVCGRCGKTRRGGCACWVRCGCGWTKERGTPGCQRCIAVKVTRIGPSRYEALPGGSRVTTRKDGIHWLFTVECGCGCGISREDDRCFGTNRGAMETGIGLAFLMLDEAARSAREGD
jgi:hypothetical protein